MKEFLSKESRFEKTSLMGMLYELNAKKAQTGNVKLYYDKIVDACRFVMQVNII